MNGGPTRWRRWALRLAQYASRVIPDGRSPWAEAMRHEIDHIADDRAALRWAVGCVLASYRTRLTDWSWSGARAAMRPLATGGGLALLFALALQDYAGGQTEPPPPAFAETTCNQPGVAPEIHARLRCGTVSVPRDYADPGAGRFKLAVVVIRSTQQPVLSDPVVYISGGPGNPITVYAAHQARTPYAPRRDLILVDQRGTGRSEPSLCPDFKDRLLEATIALAASISDETKAQRQAAYLACRDQAIARGFDLRNFGTRVTVEDFEQVRQALGLKRWNVYGESYGTTVAMTLAALHPDAVRTLVLDSIYPPDPVPPRSATVNDARDAFFAHCARDDDCAASFPDLAGTYRDTLTRLDQSPLMVTVPTRQAEYRVNLTSSLFEAVVTNRLYFSAGYPGLPRMIQSVHDGDTQGLGTVLAAQLAAAMTLNQATHAAVECRDRPHLRKPLPPDAGAHDHRLLYGICDLWSELGPPTLVPAGTGVPTLVLAGQFDPVARPALSRHVAERIGSMARFVEFPLVGHNVRQSSRCGARIAADFIDQPAQPTDTSCTDRVAPIRFLPKLQAP